MSLHEELLKRQPHISWVDLSKPETQASLKKFQAVFAFILNGGEMHPSRAEILADIAPAKDIHPVGEPGDTIGIRLGGPKPKNNKTAITFVLGTHPNEPACWAAAARILQNWKENKIPHDKVDIYLIIGGPHKRIGEFFQTVTVEGTKRLPVGQYTEFRKQFFINSEGKRDSHNWNRVRAAWLKNWLGRDKDNEPHIRHKRLEKEVYSKSQAVISLHSLSTPSIPLVLVQSKAGDESLRNKILKKFEDILTPNFLLPAIVCDLIESYPSGTVVMDGVQKSMNDPLRLCVECGGPHWLPKIWENGEQIADYFVQAFLHRMDPIGVEAPDAHKLRGRMPLPENAGIYTRPVIGLYHPAHSPSRRHRALIAKAANEQGISLEAIKNDTFCVISGNAVHYEPGWDKNGRNGHFIILNEWLPPDISPLDRYDGEMLVQRQKVDAYRKQYLKPKPGVMERWLGKAFGTVQVGKYLPPDHLFNTSPVFEGDPIMVGKDTGFVVPSPVSGFTFMSPADIFIPPDFKEQVLMVLDCPSRKLERKQSSHLLTEAVRKAGSQEEAELDSKRTMHGEPEKITGETLKSLTNRRVEAPLDTPRIPGWDSAIQRIIDFSPPKEEKYARRWQDTVELTKEHRTRARHANASAEPEAEKPCSTSR
jgi:hypothetical protein